MSYFSRLTDIVTCNLTDILSRASDPQGAIEEIIHEMEEGLAGARRSVKTARANEQSIKRELDEHAQRAEYWAAQAKQQLADGEEDKARQSLFRKREAADLMAGLEQQHAAAVATCDHLSTTLRALEARLAEAQRKKQAVQEEAAADEPEASPAAVSPPPAEDDDKTRARQVEEELEALRRELGSS